jgi:hypothetical protein
LILTVDTGVKRDLTDIQMTALDVKLRTRIPQLVSWSYSSLTGELTLDFGEVEDSSLLAKIQDWLAKADGVKVLRFGILEMVKEWQG